MSERDPKLTDFDDLEPLPEGALAELPEEVVMEELDTLEPLPAETLDIEEMTLTPEPPMKPAAPVQPKQVVKPAPVAKKPIAAKPAPKAAAAPVPKQVAPKPAAPAPVKADVPSNSEGDSKSKASESREKPQEAAAKPAASAAPAMAKAGSASRSSRGSREPRQPKPKHNAWQRWTGPGEKPKREMEAAPALLRKAAMGLFIGCLLPWGGVTPDWAGNIGEKILVLIGLFVWHQTNCLRDGQSVKGFITKLGSSSFIPLIAIAGLFALVGFAPIFSFASLSMENAGPFAEKGFMILAGLTLTHIHSYEYGGRFNPMFPLMFLAPAIAGVMALVKIFSVEEIGIGQILGGLGAIAVSVAGCLAAYTMYTAIKEAKVHGEAKKLAAAEARKVARKARK